MSVYKFKEIGLQAETCAVNEQSLCHSIRQHVPWLQAKDEEEGMLKLNFLAMLLLGALLCGKPLQYSLQARIVDNMACLALDFTIWDW